MPLSKMLLLWKNTEEKDMQLLAWTMQRVLLRKAIAIK